MHVGPKFTPSNELQLVSWTPPKSRELWCLVYKCWSRINFLNIPVLSWYIVSFENLHSKKKFSLICTCRKECNKYDLTAAQYFWLVDHNDWSMWFVAISSPSPPTYFACPSFSFFIGGVEPEYITILGLWKIFSQSSHILSTAGDALRSW